MMFGLPGATQAIYHCSCPENRSKVAGIMLAAAFASFFTCITELLDFSFYVRGASVVFPARDIARSVGLYCRTYALDWRLLL